MMRIERRRNRAVMLIAAATTAAVGLAHPAAAEIDTEAALLAIQHSLCMSAMKLTSQVRPAVMTKNGDIAYVKIDGLLTNYTWAGSGQMQSKIYAVFSREGEAAEFRSQSFPVNRRVEGEEALEVERKFLAGPQQKIQFVEPVDCHRRRLVDTPMKLQLLKAIEETMVRALSDSNRRGFRHYPRRLKIMVESFNFDDGGTDVFIPSRGEVYTSATFSTGLIP